MASESAWAYQTSSAVASANVRIAARYLAIAAVTIFRDSFAE